MIDVVTVSGIVAGLGLRIWAFSAPSLGSLDADEAVWGLMARHLLDGDWTTFFWGQNYGGSQEAILTAGLFGLVGTSTLALKIVPAVLYAVAAVLVWRIGRRTVGEPAARIAAVLLWIWPAYFVWRSTKAYGFYQSGLVLGLAVVLLSLRLQQSRSRSDAAAFGLALGLGWWATPQIVILAVPALAWLFWRRPSVIRDWWIALPAFVVGALPWFAWNVRNSWDSFQSTQAHTSEAGHLHNLFTAVLPTALGLRVPFSLDWIVTPIFGWALFTLALAGFAWLVWRRPPNLGLLLLTCPVFLLVYVISPYTFLSAEPRYLAMIQPVLALLVALALVRPWVAAAGVTAALALTLVGLVDMERSNLMTPRINGVTVPSEVKPLLRALDRADAKIVSADYWVAYLIDFESRERIIASPAPLTGEGRYLPWIDLLQRSANPAHVFVRGSGRGERARPGLLRAGYRRLEVGGYDVYVPRPRPAAAREEPPAESASVGGGPQAPDPSRTRKTASLSDRGGQIRTADL